MDIVERRFSLTLAFVQESLSPPARILDLGVDNPMAIKMRAAGFDVLNTPEVDLDLDPSAVCGFDVEAVTAFEILEHLINPFSVLQQLEAQHLFATVPLRLWFARAYRNQTDILDQHYHEFDPWQFDRLLQKSGWKVKRKTTWTGPTSRIGLRPLLRRYTPRYYATEAVRL